MFTLEPMKPLATQLWRPLTESTQRGHSWNYQVRGNSKQDTAQRSHEGPKERSLYLVLQQQPLLGPLV